MTTISSMLLMSTSILPMRRVRPKKKEPSDLVAEVTRWGLEATGLNVDRPASGGH